MEKSEVLNLLREGSIDIEFVKADGTLRFMTATLKQDKLPEFAEDASPKARNPEVVSVFDVFNQGWRSFRWDSLKKVNGSKVSFVE